MNSFKDLVKNNKSAISILIASLLIVIPLGLNFFISNQAQNSPASQLAQKDPLKEKFDYLSSHGNSSCSGDFLTSIPTMADNARLECSCCSAMVFSKYKTQVEGLKKYSSIPQIPADPYDIPASLAKELLNYDKTITPTADEQKVLDKAVADSPEKGYCCCKCWRWYVYEGLSKYLVHNNHFTSSQITDILANSDGCGGA